MNHDFAGKVAFVTGAGSGIGRVTAVAFASSGADVAVVDVDKEGLEETVRLIEQVGRSSVSIICDVAKEDQVAAALKKTVDTFGKLDLAFNNAGIVPRDVPVAEIATDDWNRVINVNLTGIFNCLKHELPHLLANGGGSIVNTSSGAGVKGFAGISAYVASKHGVVGLTKSAALDYAERNIRINAICPGIIDTPMMDLHTGGTDEGRAAVIADEPIGRMGRPEEIAAAVLWLCSDAASFVLGHAMVVDGGQTTK